jgi:hypothetical protein
VTIDVFCKWLAGFEMARKLRVEFEGAVYHVMNRGDQRERIFVGEEDRKLFLATLGQACAKTDVSGKTESGNHDDLGMDCETASPGPLENGVQRNASHFETDKLDEPQSLVRLREEIARRLPRVDLGVWGATEQKTGLTVSRIRTLLSDNMLQDITCLTPATPFW